MEHNSFKEKNENLDVFFKGNNENKFKLYKATSSNTIVDITPTVNIVSLGNNLYKQNITLPNEDCVVMALFNDQALFLRVGNPNVQVYYYYPLEENIPLYRYAPNGGLIESGDMSYLGHGIYTYVTSDLDYSIINIHNQQVALDVPYPVCDASGSGTLILNANTWNTVALYIEGMRISELINEIGANNIEAANAPNNGSYLNYIVGVTPSGSTNDFYLLREDNGVTEMQPFFIKVKDIGSDIVYERSN